MSTSPWAVKTRVVNITIPEPIWERAIAVALRDYCTPQEAIRRFLIDRVDEFSPLPATDAPIA